MSHPKTAIVYCRVSTHRQKESETIRAQVERCQRLVERHGLQLLPYGPKGDGWLLDEGTTGTLLDGRQFATFIDDLLARRVKSDALVVFSLSRISRVDKVGRSEAKIQQSHADNAKIVGALISRKVLVIDEDGANDPASIGTQIKMMLANESYRTIREQTMAGKHRVFGEGKFAKGGHPPFGYVQVPVNGVDRKQGYRLEPHPEQADQLKRIVAWYCEKGLTHAARRATEEAIPTPMASTAKRKNKAKDWTPTRWSPVTIQHIVRNIAAYTGVTTYIYDGKPYEIRYPALLDHKTIARVRKRAKEQAIAHRGEFLSTGFIDCACGTRVYVRRSGDKTHHVRCETCRWSMRMGEFDRALRSCIACRLVEIQKQAPVVRDDGQFATELQSISKELDSVDAQSRRLLDAELTGRYGPRIVEQKSRELRDQRLALETRRQEIELERERTAQRRLSEDALLHRATQTINRLASGDATLAEERQILSDLLAGQRLVASQLAGSICLEWPAHLGAPMRLVDLTQPVAPQFTETRTDPPARPRTTSGRRAGVRPSRTRHPRE